MKGKICDERGGNMTRFEMVKYHGQTYPSFIPLRIEEIAAHFDVQTVDGNLGFSLHTEYSYGKRKFDTELINKYPAIRDAQKDGVPQLWKNETWAFQFSDFIVDLVSEQEDPQVIEVHPPFNDYTDMAGFVKNYSVFERRIKERYPGVEILIENRCGSVYRGGKFILSKTQDLLQLADLVNAEGLELKLAYDVPQIYTAHNVKTEQQYIKWMKEIKDIRWFIGGVHLWGKRVSASGRKVAHCGDLNSYFGDETVKESFLKTFVESFDDGVPRKMVLEVNSGNEDLTSIVTDLLAAGVEFV